MFGKNYILEQDQSWAILKEILASNSPKPNYLGIINCIAYIVRQKFRNEVTIEVKNFKKNLLKFFNTNEAKQEPGDKITKNKIQQF